MESKLGTGKLPPDLLRGLVLGRLGARRPETLVPAALGIDAAAIVLGGDSACVLTSDPITTATHGSGRLGVHVVCNDLAAMGAEPVGLLVTLLLPAGITPSAIAELCGDIDAAARELNVEILGGHTEVAPGITAPLIVMSGVGKAPRSRVITAAGARVGDALVLTKAAGLEGSHILANDFAAQLANRVPAALLEQARNYGAELSVVPEARIAAQLGATAMHDPTEGGVIGALWEMAEASGHGVRVHADAIAVREPTRLICQALGADPLRLIASGALLIACPDGAAVRDALAEAGIAASVIGSVIETGREIEYPDGRVETIQSLPRDELYRLLE